MARIVLTDEDIKRATPPEPGWHLFKITEYEEKDRSKLTPPKEGLEYKFTLEVLKSSPDAKEDNIGRIFFANFYSTGVSFMMPFVSAVMDMPIKKAIDFDPDEFVNQQKQVMGELVKGVYQGKANLRFENWAPASGCPF